MAADVFTAGCSARRAVALVADKWAILAVYALAVGPRRLEGNEIIERIGDREL